MRKGEEDRRDIIGQCTFIERDLPQNAPRQDVKVERGRNLEKAQVVDQRTVKQFVIEDGVAFRLVA
jgi:hypothetical protein